MSSASISPCESPSNARWQAHLRLGFARNATRTVLARRVHTGPLLVQRPFHPEGDVCHVYVVHPPGGIVAGDDLRLDARLDAASHALITTPAATKFYRAFGGREARLVQHLDLPGATLEWLPQETLFFNAARARSLTRLSLDVSSRCIAWEMSSFGRPANDERFDAGCARLGLEVWLGERPLLLDHLRIEGAGAAMTAPWGLAGCAALGSLVAFPCGQDELVAVRELAAARGLERAFSATLLGALLLCRMTAADAKALRDALLPVWQLLRPRLLGRPPVPPRIWST